MSANQANPVLRALQESVSQLLEAQKRLSSLNELWMPDDERIALGSLIRLSYPGNLAIHVAYSLTGSCETKSNEELRECRLEEEFEAALSADGFLSQLNTRGKFEVKEIPEIATRLRSIHMFVADEYWRTFQLDRFGDNRSEACEWWNEYVREKIDAEPEYGFGSPPFSEWLDGELRKLGIAGCPPSTYPQLRESWLTKVPEELPLAFYKDWEEYKSEYSACIAGLLDPKSKEVWVNWQRKYFHNLEKRGEFTAMLLQALGLVEPQVKSRTMDERWGYGFIYFIRNGDIYKIGSAGDLAKKIVELRADEILNVARCSNYRALERLIHAEFRSVRIPQTEYFRLSEEQIESVHRMINKQAIRW
jgi:hypothetical protein